MGKQYTAGFFSTLKTQWRKEAYLLICSIDEAGKAEARKIDSQTNP